MGLVGFGVVRGGGAPVGCWAQHGSCQCVGHSQVMGAAGEVSAQDDQVTVPAQLQSWPGAGSCTGTRHAAELAVVPPPRMGCLIQGVALWCWEGLV